MFYPQPWIYSGGLEVYNWLLLGLFVVILAGAWRAHENR